MKRRRMSKRELKELLAEYDKGEAGYEAALHAVNEAGRANGSGPAKSGKDGRFLGMLGRPSSDLGAIFGKIKET